MSFELDTSRLRVIRVSYACQCPICVGHGTRHLKKRVRVS